LTQQQPQLEVCVIGLCDQPCLHGAGVSRHAQCGKSTRKLVQPIAVETIGVFNSSANGLLKEIALKISANTLR